MQTSYFLGPIFLALLISVLLRLIALSAPHIWAKKRFCFLLLTFTLHNDSQELKKVTGDMTVGTSEPHTPAGPWLFGISPVNYDCIFDLNKMKCYIGKFKVVLLCSINKQQTPLSGLLRCMFRFGQLAHTGSTRAANLRCMFRFGQLAHTSLTRAANLRI